MHDAETYFVDRLDTDEKVAYVHSADVDYYTQAVLDSNIRAGGPAAERPWAAGRLGFGEATVTWRTTAFKKIKFYTQESIGYSRLELPAQHLETNACWFVPPQEALALPAQHGLNAIEGLVGIRNVAVNLLPLLAMCDRLDVGGIVDRDPIPVEPHPHPAQCLVRRRFPGQACRLYPTALAFESDDDLDRRVGDVEPLERFFRMRARRAGPLVTSRGRRG